MKEKQMRTGMSTACFFGRVYNEQALVEMAKLGVKEAEIFFSAHMEYRPDYIKEIQKICDGEGIAVRSVHALPTQFEPQLFSLHNRQLEEALGVYDEVLAAAQALGAGVYVFHGPMRLKIAKNTPVDFQFAGERTSMLADRAKPYHVALCYENVHWCWYRYPGFARELVQNSTSDNLYFTLDMKQAAQSGYDVLQYIDDMGARLRHIHVCDYENHPEKGVIPCLPFRGQTDWTSVRQRLREIRYSYLLMLEVYANDYGGYGELKQTYDAFTQFFAGQAPDEKKPAV